jgi:hypothetical protein
VRWKGWIDLERLEGMASIQFDEEFARVNFYFFRREK